MNQLRNLSLVEYIYCDRFAVAQPQDRTRSRTVVSGCLSFFLWCDLPFDRRDANGQVGSGIFACSLQTDTSRQFGANHSTQQSQKFSTLHVVPRTKLSERSYRARSSRFLKTAQMHSTLAEAP